MAGIAIGTGAVGGVAADAINKLIVAPLIQTIEDLIKLPKNSKLLQQKLTSMKFRLEFISETFEGQQREPAGTITDCLKRTKVKIDEGKKFIDGSQWCLNCLYARHMREWIIEIDQLRRELREEITFFVDAQHMILLSQQQQQTLLQSVPETGIVGSRIKDAEAQLREWIDSKAQQVRVIGIYGMAGVGKTTLLGTVYNYYNVRKSFDFLILVSVSQDSKIWDLQCQIAEAIGLDLSSTSSEVTRKMRLSQSLLKKNFLLILDNIWVQLKLQEDLGVEFGADKVSKVVFSSRDKRLMKADKLYELKPLPEREGRELFEKVAFKGGDVPGDLKDCARKFADECGGLPLAITVVASAITLEETVGDWNNSLSLMQQADPSFQRIHPSIGKDLYGRLKWSYDVLPSLEVKNCFLYCAMYPKNPKIDVDILVRMWIAEGFVESTEASYLRDMELGYRYVKLLVDRFLFQNDTVEKLSVCNVEKPKSVWKRKYITVHDAIREMSISIADDGRNCFSRAGQQLEDFPARQTSDCKRLSLSHNQIKYLPKDFKCPELVSLILSENPIIYNDHLESFLTNLTCLRVLDLSHTSIQSVPTSLAQLTLLKFLTLEKTPISSVPENICDLSSLQFLDLSSCENLRSLPSTMERLTQLQYLNLSGMSWDLTIPLDISQLTSLKRLELYTENPKALQGITNLIELNVTISSKPGADEIDSSIGSCLQMKHLSLRYMELMAVRDPLPEMQRMKSLNTLDLVADRDFLPGIERMRSLMTLVSNNLMVKTLPNFICEFQQLERLEFIDCYQLTKLCPLEQLPKLKFLKFKKCTELKDLEIGCSGEPNGFPMLQRLYLIRMPKLQSLATPILSGGVLVEGTLSKLLVLKIIGCPLLKRLPSGMESLSSLQAIIGEDYWWKDIFWPPKIDMKTRLHRLFRKYKIQ